MQILLITHYFQPDAGAAAVRLSRLAKLLQQRGHELTILTTMPHYPIGEIREGYRGKFTLTDNVDGLKIVRAWLWATPNPRISRKLLSQMSFMFSLFVRGIFLPRPDVVLVEAQPMFTNFAATLVATLKRVPFVLNVSDLWPDHLLSVGAMTDTHPVYRIARALVDMMYRRASAIITLAPGWSEIIKTYVPHHPHVQTIANGVDLARFHPNVDYQVFCERYQIDTTKPIVSFIGTFATQYDYDVMLATAEQLVSYDVLFLYIGGGSQVERIKAVNLPNLHYLGWVEHEEIPQAWRLSTLSYWAMRDEPLYHHTIPAKMYEATASGVPIVAAMDGKGADIINKGEFGLVVQPGDAAALSQTIHRLLNDHDQLAQFSHNARTYAEEYFNPEKVADAYENVLQAAASR